MDKSGLLKNKFEMFCITQVYCIGNQSSVQWRSICYIKMSSELNHFDNNTFVLHKCAFTSDNAVSAMFSIISIYRYISRYMIR